LEAYRKPVHVRPQEHRRAGAVLHDAHDAGSADAFRYGRSSGPKFLGHDLGGSVLFEAELGILVKVDEQGAEILVVVGFDRGCEVGRCECGR
jgi:hypothetical protein